MTTTSTTTATTTGTQGAQGIIGLQGTQGTQGYVGVQGSQGTAGINGSQGAQGSQGRQGTQGYTGPQGAIGSQGSVGSQGLIGTGLQGIQGYVGSTGIQGSIGVQGYNGIQGSQGYVGSTGTQGKIGVQGYNGIQGSQGYVGIQGNMGPQGWVGSQGFQGLQGLLGIIGSQGSIGSQGNVGSQGLLGATGQQGVQGQTGTFGAQGSTGAVGSQGIQGFQGTQGYQGAIGTQGIKGSTGTQGIVGLQGTGGSLGPQGAVGSLGLTAGTGITLTQTSGTTVISLTPPSIVVTPSVSGPAGITTVSIANGFTAAEVQYLLSYGSTVPTTWNTWFPPGDLRRYGAACNGTITALVQNTGTSDSKALNTATTLFSAYGQDIIFPSGCVVTLTQQHLITAPPNSIGKIIGYGSVVITTTSTNFIFLLQNKPGTPTAANSGMSIQGLTTLQTNNTSTIGAFDVNGASKITFQDCVFLAENVSSNYTAIKFRESTLGDAGTGSFWCRVKNCQFLSVGGFSPQVYMNAAITTVGACNSLVIDQTQFTLVSTGISVQPVPPGTPSGATASNLANSLIVTSCAFEGITNGIVMGNTATTSSWSVAGLTVTNNRVENVTTFLTLNASNALGAATNYPTYYAGNTYIGVTTAILNTWNLPISGVIGNNLSGSATISSGTTVTSVVFSTYQFIGGAQNTNYRVSLTPTRGFGGTLCVTAKSTTSFNVSNYGSTGTVLTAPVGGWPFDWYVHTP